MRNKISLVVLTGSGSRAKQFCTSRATLRWLAGAALIASGVFAFVLYDYIQLKHSGAAQRLRAAEMSGTLTGQQEEIDLQRRQIGEFAEVINQLKERLLSLNAFEKKIRIMADLEKRPDAGGLFGVGGPIPRALDPKEALGDERKSLVREMHSQVDQLNLGAVTQGNGFQTLVRHLEKQQTLIASTPTIRPIDPDAEQLVTSRFDYRNSPFTGMKEFHRAIDISAREGTPIYVDRLRGGHLLGREGAPRPRDHHRPRPRPHDHLRPLQPAPEAGGRAGQPLGHRGPRRQYRQQHRAPHPLRGGGAWGAGES